jgi:hypothetical protein
MNWLGRLLFGGEFTTPAAALPEAAASAPLSPLTQCPECESLDFTRLCSIVGVRRSTAGVETVERGARYCCENCATIWSVSPTGVRKANPRAVPVVMQPPRPREDQEQDTRKTPPIRDEQPIPRQRPRV